MSNLVSGNTGITKEEYLLILQLKENVKDLLPAKITSKSVDDQNLYFVRWIRARENNIEKATDMLRNSIEWRIQRKADEALNFKIHVFYRENFSFSFPGLDKQGQPVVCIPFNEWDFRKIVADPDRLQEFEDFMTYYFENVMNQIEQAHQNRPIGASPVTQLTLILDAKGFPYGQLIKYAAVKKIMQAGSTYEAHYPECVCQIIFLNCPSYFGMLLNILKPVVAPKTMGKIKCYSSLTKWQAEMEKIVSPDILQERYGGILQN